MNYCKQYTPSIPYLAGFPTSHPCAQLNSGRAFHSQLTGEALWSTGAHQSAAETHYRPQGQVPDPMLGASISNCMESTFVKHFFSTYRDQWLVPGPRWLRVQRMPLS
eukprot:6213367-Pleurochrysis_carterae.AAC.4